MIRRAGSVLLAVIILAALSAAPARAAGGRIQVGDVRPYAAETPHPYPKTWTDRIFSPGAEFIRVHFTGLHLGDGDALTVASPDGSQVWTYTGRGPHGNGDVWSFAIGGDTAIVSLQGGRGNGYGYRITEIGHGTVNLHGKKNPPTTEVVCGTDGREDIACYPSLVTGAARPVARLLFVSGGFQYVCTGWLVAGSSNSTMLTNNHCLDTQTEVNTLQSSFNFQYSTCGGSTLAGTANYNGGTFLKTNTEKKRGNKGGLDYTILTVAGNPEATFGELVASSTAPVVGRQINFIQHPGGNPKDVGHYEDAGHTTLCTIATINQTYGFSATGSQTGYGCDSEGGSSGSPIVDAVTGKAIGLHHYGGVSSSPCLNGATMMSRVCTDAGALLSCQAN
jgi:V8-like Glu-specific endopeptidase